MRVQNGTQAGREGQVQGRNPPSSVCLLEFLSSAFPASMSFAPMGPMALETGRPQDQSWECQRGNENTPTGSRVGRSHLRCSEHQGPAPSTH